MAQTLLRDIKRIRSCRCTLRAAVRGDHRPALRNQSPGGVQSDSRGGACDQNGSGGCHQAERRSKNLSLPAGEQTTRNEDIKCCMPPTAGKPQTRRTSQSTEQLRSKHARQDQAGASCDQQSHSQTASNQLAIPYIIASSFHENMKSKKKHWHSPHSFRYPRQIDPINQADHR